VTVGIDGHAGHFERLLAPDAGGYFERATVAHEVSAVTGACLVVSRANFASVGGFDEVNLPVEFNDIDLCLRLREKTLSNIIDNTTILIHHEAATRKARLDQEDRYKDQVDYFKDRWRRVIRADPYFGSGLSLNWHWAALG
jgi:GT2 family glycosyltransferase